MIYQIKRPRKQPVEVAVDTINALVEMLVLDALTGENGTPLPVGSSVTVKRIG